MSVPLTPTTALLHSILDGQAYTATPHRSFAHLPQSKEPDVFALAFANTGSTEKRDNGRVTSGSSSSTSRYPSVFSLRSETSATPLETEFRFGDFSRLPQLAEGNSAQVCTPGTMSLLEREFDWAIEGDMSIDPAALSTLEGFRSHNRTLDSNISTAPIKRTRRPRRKRQPPSAAELHRKREAFLRRNRLAATKCRTRKKNQTLSLETRAREIQDTKVKLDVEYQEVMEEVTALREAVRLRPRCCEKWELSLS